MQVWQDIVQWSIAVHLLLIVGGLLMLALIANVLRQHRNPAASAAWLIFMLAVPYLGVPLYLFFGTRKVASIHARKAPLFVAAADDAAPSDDPAARYLQRMGLPPPLPAQRVRFHAGADAAWQTLREMLIAARRSIDLCLFILGDDRVGREVLDILTERARHGVRVRLLLDGVGSFLLPNRRLRPLQQAGGETAWFVPVLHRPLRGRTNLRNHRKLVIVDDGRVWSGGRNVALDYLDPPDAGRWFDLSFDLCGEAVDLYRRLFEADWHFAVGGTAPAPVPVRQDYVSSGAGGTASLVQAIPSGPDLRQDLLHDLLVSLIAGAREHIVLVSPYFVPDEVLLTLLRLSAQRGVRVELLLPRRSNHRLADVARARSLRQLAEAGAQVRLLPDAMLHAKAVVIDHRYALAGSANLDLRSLFLNFELMTLFYGAAEIDQLADWIDGLRGRCRAWTPGPAGPLRQTLEGLVLLAAFQL